MLRDNPGYSYLEPATATAPTPVPVTVTVEVELRADAYDELMAYDVDVKDLARQYVEADEDLIAMREGVRDKDREDFRQLLWLIDSDIRYHPPVEHNKPSGCNCRTCFTIRTWHI